METHEMPIVAFWAGGASPSAAPDVYKQAVDRLASLTSRRDTGVYDHTQNSGLVQLGS